MLEEWRDVHSTKNYYAVSSLGRVKSHARNIRFVDKTGSEQWRLKSEKIISSQKQNGGYLLVHLHIDNRRVARTVHSLVAECFIGARPRGFDVCHLNGVRTDNRARNLRYDTRSNNFQDMHKHGTYYSRISNGRLTAPQVRKIRSLQGYKTPREVARQFGIKNEWHIVRIWRRENWGHIK